MKERQYLKKSILLCGKSDEGIFKRTFTIGKVINQDKTKIKIKTTVHLPYAMKHIMKKAAKAS